MGLQMLQVHGKAINNMTISQWQIQETNMRLGIGFLAMFLYLLVGAVVFVQIEGTSEAQDIATYNEFQNYWNRALAEAGFAESDVDQLFADIREMVLKGIWNEKNVTSEPNWNFGQAFFFAAGLISTVGYGRVAPRTHAGKFFTIVYCIVGIPIALTLLSSFMVRLRQPSVWLRGKINARFGNVLAAFQLQLLHLFIVSALLLIFVFIIPSYIFTAIERDWNFLDAFFYCFVSLTTIGLGDDAPGDSPEQSFRTLYKVIASVYLLFGLTCMMLFIATFYDVPQFNLMKFFLTKNDNYVDLSAGDIEQTTVGNPNYTFQPYGRQFDDDDETHICDPNSNGSNYQQ